MCKVKCDLKKSQFLLDITLKCTKTYFVLFYKIKKGRISNVIIVGCQHGRDLFK